MSTTASETLLNHWIGGRRDERPAERHGEVTDPATGEVVARVPFATADDVDRTVAAATEAARGWGATSLTRRTQVMFAFRELVAAHKDELAALITREHGKVLDDARGEVTRGLEVIEFACGLGQLLKGEMTPQVSGGVDSHSMRMPLGVVAGITPFNFPVMVPLWMAPVALACGNAFILKPSEQDPSPGMRLAELLAEAGLPDGVFSVVHGDRVAVDAILEHPGIAAVSFVGSTPVARHIYETGTANGKRVQALGGAKNHAVILPDADLDLAADGLVSAAYGSAGQRCMAVSVAVTVGDVAEPLLDKIRERIEKLDVGPGTDPSSDMGPLVSQAHYDKVAGLVDSGVEEGAELAVDGRGIVVEGHEGGYFLGPCVFDRVEPGMRDLRRGDLRPGAGRRARRQLPRGARARQRQRVRQRRGDLHLRRRRRAAVRAAGDGRHDRRQRPDPGPDGLPLVRRLEGLAVRRPAHARTRRRPLLHARQGGHDPLAGPGDAHRRQPGLPDADLTCRARSARSSATSPSRLASSARIASNALSARCSAPSSSDRMIHSAASSRPHR